MEGSTLTGAVFESSLFKEANLDKADLSYSNFQKANFTDANLSHANLNRANFQEANFTDANLDSANATDGDFAFAKFNGAFLYLADFTRSRLQEINLSNAHIKAAIFMETDLARSNFSGTIFWDFKKWEERHTKPQKSYEDDYFFNRDLTYDDYKRHSKPNFRLAKNLTIDQIRVADNYKKAIYNDDLCQLLNIDNTN
ncbi:pentapeptide repeat-containing protein [Microcoleus sp. FACHB-672]|nr:pentapeptide repeat-containing protein [Microcoleus sp. FACHB-672]